MNFKEVYSDANDEIHGSDILLDKILSAHEKKKFRIPTFIPVVAVVAMIAVVVAVPGIMKEKIPEGSPGVRVADIRGAEDLPETSATPEPEIVKEQVAVSEQTNQQTHYESYEVPENTAVAAEEATDVVAVNYTELLAGAEPSVMSRNIEQKPTKEMTAEEYVVYIGKDIAREAAIPQDMTMESPEIINAEIDEAGLIISEKAIYFAHSEDYDRFAEINVSRTQDILIPENGMEVSVICGNQVIIISDSTDYNASFSENGVQYFIRCGGVTESELKNLLISLNGGSTNEQEDFSRNNGGIGGGIVTGNDDGISG